MKKTRLLVISFFIFCSFAVPVSAYDASEARTYADFLNTLGLFSGVGTDASGNPIYNLDQPANRQEGLTMLIRLIGKEKDAVSGRWSHPFTDVESWADPFVGYAYTNGLTSGVSNTKFGAMDPINSQDFATMALRALGYEDGAGGDFTYSGAAAFYTSLGMSLEPDVNVNDFRRGDMVFMAMEVIHNNVKDTNGTLLGHLSDDGVITWVQTAEAQKQLANESAPKTNGNDDYYYVNLGSTNEQIYAGDLYTVPVTTGEYAGFSELKNFGRLEQSYRFLFLRENEKSIRYKLLELQSLSATVNWTYNGKTYTSSRSEIQSFFEDVTDLASLLGIQQQQVTTAFLDETFGQAFDDWFNWHVVEQDMIRLIGRYENYQAGWTPTPVTIQTTPDLVHMDIEKWGESISTLHFRGVTDTDHLEPLMFGDEKIEGYVNIYRFTGGLEFYLPDMTDEFINAPDETTGTFSGIRMVKRDGKVFCSTEDLKREGIKY